MSESGEERSTQPSMLVRADEIQQQIQQISGRDLQLWSIGILVILVGPRDCWPWSCPIWCGRSG